jgi:hypothetical protein
MSVATVQLAELTQQERDACTEYYADATFLHACSQGWSGAFPDSKKFEKFREGAKDLVAHLDKAIPKFQVSVGGIVFSGHGTGISVIGSLIGPAEQFVGFRCCYPGYVSSSVDRAAAESFLRTRSSGARMPVLMEIKLEKGDSALPMDRATGACGEAEYLLKRSIVFEVIAADLVRIQGVEQDVLQLGLSTFSSRS